MDLGFMVRIVQLGFIILMTRTSLLRFNFGLTRIIEMGFKICMACTRIVVVVFNHQLSFYHLGEGQNNSFGGLSYGPKTSYQNLQQHQIQRPPRSLTLVSPRHECEYHTAMFVYVCDWMARVQSAPVTQHHRMRRIECLYGIVGHDEVKSGCWMGTK